MPDDVIAKDNGQQHYGIYATSTEPPALVHRYARVAHNLTIREGMLHTKPGLRKITGVQLGTVNKRTVYNVDVYKGTTDDSFIILTGDSMQSLSVEGGDPVDLATSYPSGFPAWVGSAPSPMFHMAGMLIYGNGASPPRKYNGTNVTRLGIVAPAALSAPSFATGIITGTYGYRATHVSTAVTGSAESDPTAVTSVTYTAQQGTFSSPTVANADPQVDRWNLYRDIGGVYHRINLTPVTLATSIVDNLTDADVVSGVTMDDIGENAPPTGNFFILTGHQGRAVGVGPVGRNTLQYSSLGLDLAGLYPKPHAWPASNAITFPDAGGTGISAVISFYEWIIVFQRYAIWSIRGDLNDSENRLISPLLVGADYRGLGAANSGCVAIMDNKIVFAGDDQPYKIQRDLNADKPDLTVSPLGDNISALWQKINFNVGAVSTVDRAYKRWVFIGKGA